MEFMPCTDFGIHFYLAKWIAYLQKSYMLAEINLADAVNPSINRDAFDDLYVNSLIVVGAIRGVIAQKEAVGFVKLKRRLQKEDDASNILPLLCIPRLISLPVFFSPN